MTKNIKREKFEIQLKKVKESDSLLMTFKQRQNKRNLFDIPSYETLEVEQSVSTIIKNKKIKFNVGDDIKYSLKASHEPVRSAELLEELARDVYCKQPNLASHKRKIYRKMMAKESSINLTVSTADSKMSSYSFTDKRQSTAESESNIKMLPICLSKNEAI